MVAGDGLPGKGRRLAVLFHRKDRGRKLSVYAVYHLAEFWREAGYEVVFLFGTRERVPADLILVHIDLSVVPEEYLEFAARYPLVLNGRVRDIRKSAFSENLIHRPDAPWMGRVIVKSDLNNAGRPERWLFEPSWARGHETVMLAVRLVERLAGRRPPFLSAQDYQIFDSLGAVPGRCFRDRRLVIEKFQPEVENGMYHTRIYQFLGDRSSCTRLVSSKPIVNDASVVRTETVTPHHEIETWRQEMGLDYGKLDYVVVDGKPILLDVNKTTGTSRGERREDLYLLRRHRAAGIDWYFGDRAWGREARPTGVPAPPAPACGPGHP